MRRYNILSGTLLALALCTAWPAAAADPRNVNVRERPYRAAGDGKTDDTRAIQRAMEAVSAAGGGIVHLPAGEYYIAGHLRVPAGVTLLGVARTPQLWNPKYSGSLLLAVEGAGNAEGTPFITLLGPNSTIEGIAVFYPKQILAEEPVAYPWTVRGGGGGDNVSIINVLLVNPYLGVDFGTRSTQRHYIRGLYGQPLLKGIWVDQCYDIGRIETVHFWPFWTQDKRIVDFTTNHGTTFIFQRTDWEVVSDIFCWGYKTGIVFSSSDARGNKGMRGINGMNGQMSNINLDNVDIGIDISGTQPYAVHISNLNVANAGAGDTQVAIWGRNSAKGAELSVRGGSFWGRWNQILRWEIAGTVTLADSRILRWNHRVPAIELAAGRAMIHDNSFTNSNHRTGTAVRIGADVQGVTVHDNQLNGNFLVNEGGSQVALSNNQP